MKIYIETRIMTFEEDDFEHEIVLRVENEIFYGYDLVIEISEKSSFVKDRQIEGGKFFSVRDNNSWWSFPLYEIVDNEIADFDYTKYQYFSNTERRNTLGSKIKQAYNPSSELKIIRKTLKKILDHLGLEDESFSNYNNKVEKIIKKIPKGKK